MGDCKSQMKPSKKDVSSGVSDSPLGKLSGWIGKNKTKVDKAKTFADNLAEAHTQLQGLLATKRAELSSEAGREDYNRRALARLETMNYHLESIMDLVVEYSES